MDRNADGAFAATFATADYEKRDAVPAWRELFGRTVVRVDIDPLAEGFAAEARAMSWRGFGLIRVSTAPVRQQNSPALIDNDDFSFGSATFAPSGRRPWSAQQAGRSADLKNGDGVFLSNGDIGSITLPQAGRFIAFSVPASAVAALTPDPAAWLGRRLPAASPELRLLLRYLQLAGDERCLATPELRSAFATHVVDLLALCLGARRDAREAAEQRGVRAARLQAMKDDIATLSASPQLSVGLIASRHGVSPRYVQSLFEADGATFTGYLMETRLSAVHRALQADAGAARTISAVAFDAGFTDLSHFNRTFRRRFGCTPSEVRRETWVGKAD